ncbi:hypothetical protein [Streptomyces sp. Tu 3180]|uniref:hypothetical protein n=1 Tax=Streptomyces sp. Tu 3180 TaxID=2682611 RepID=UPI00135C6748|nr:hypothetical protein [Streptomyces sp. Tu 3180]KAF3463467.1 hypothetical protein GL259_03440 [Streptomyces sp. Tu 3180]
MSPTRSLTRRGTAVALTVLTAAALGAAGTGASSADTAAPQKRQVASAVLGSDYRISLTALRSADDAYAASVRLQVYTKTGGAWKESDRVTVGDVDGWFWYPLTGRGAVCEFSTAGTDSAPLTVSLLVTPSIGCSEPVHYVVKEGRVHAG